MLCPTPTEGSVGQQFPCGRCLACRINKQRRLVARLLLELAAYPDSSFVTMTYAPEHMPVSGDGSPTVCPRDLRLFWKRLRKKVGPFRYFAAAEYGNKTGRPHYHGILNIPPEVVAELLEQTWGLGFVTTSDANRARAFYTAQYVVKKQYGRSHLRNHHEHGMPHPEFRRASNRPGIGVPALPHLVAAQTSRAGAAALAATYGVFRHIRFEGKIWPLDSLMRKKLREAIGYDKKAFNPAPPPPDDLELKHAASAIEIAEIRVKRGREAQIL